ncbi:chloride channel protein [Herbaspirillum robiniae]|uniref:chloride channel protein n=1 Tax=Herbaspirillum robiniae TaxID=2014887 RepID=UPI003D7798FA
MRKMLAGLHGHTRRQVRRLWLQYGILWSGAVITGLVAVLYARLIDYGFELFRDMQGDYRLFPLVLMPAVGALCVWATRRYFPGSEGSGIPQVIASLGEQGERTTRLAAALLTLRIVAGKIALSFLAILGGFTIGREGPTVQVGAALMYNMRRFYPRPSAILEKRLILAGAAAGLAAAFNTPLAGIVFAIEELSRSFEQRASGVVITTIIFAGVVALGLTGNYTYFGTLTASVDSARNVIVSVILCGLLMGGAGGFFCWLLLNMPKWIPSPLLELRARRPVAFGALCGLAVAVIGIAAGGATYGSGYAEARGLLTGQQELSGMYPLAKMASMVGSYLPGMPGGIFAPSLSIGAGFGNLLHMLFGDISPQILIALAMVGYLAAVTQSPITSFVIVMEMVNGHALVISLMATALLASRVSRFFAPPLYEALSERYAHAHHASQPPPQQAQAAHAAHAAAPVAEPEPVHAHVTAAAVVPQSALQTTAVVPQVEPQAATTVAAPAEEVPKEAWTSTPPMQEPQDAPAQEAAAAPVEALPAQALNALPEEAQPVAAEAQVATPAAAPRPRQRRKHGVQAPVGKAQEAAPDSEPEVEAQSAPLQAVEPQPQVVESPLPAAPEQGESDTPAQPRRAKRVYRQGDLFD